MKLFSNWIDRLSSFRRPVRLNSINLALIIAFWLIIFSLFYLNTFHEKFPDEFDNILGGKYILSGIFPYSGFFSHHGPVAYFLASVIQLFSGFSFVAFRIGYSIFLFLFVLGSYLFLRRFVGEKETRFYYIFVILLGLSTTYYWMHMLIADSLAAFFILPVFGILFLKAFYQKVLSPADIVIISIGTFFMVLTAITFIYLAFFIYLFTIYLFFTNHTQKILSKSSGVFVAIFAIPFLVFLIYLFVTGSLSDYIDQSLIFNQRYYVYNYPGAGENGINPVRYAIITLQNFMGSYKSLFVQIPHFNFAFPVNVTFGIGNIALFIYLLIQRKFLLGLFFLFSLVFSNMRSNPIDSAEKDYQSAVYVMISLFSLCFVITKLYEDLSKQIDFNKRVIFSGLFVLLSGYFVATSFFFYESGTSKIFAKYMGEEPLIYDRPEVAPILNQIVPPEKTVLIGPLEFEELYYTNAKPSTKYHFLIPAMGRSPQVKEEIISELSHSEPPIIWFDKNYHIFGQNPKKYAPFFVNYIDAHYTPLGKIERDGIRFKSLMPKSERLDFETKLFLRNENLNSLIDSLIEKKLIEPS